MAERKPVRFNPGANLGLLTGIFNQFRLVWLLMKDSRVSFWRAKFVVPLSLIYLVFPFDFLPDVFLGLGQLDDLGVIMLGMALFIKLCPPNVVEYYKNQLEYGSDENPEAVDSTYRVIDEE